MRTSTAALLLGALVGCATTPSGATTTAPRSDEGELFVYVEPLVRDERDVSVTVSEVLAVSDDGLVVPLEVRSPLTAPARDRQRLVASGPVAAGRYVGLAVRVTRATVGGAQGQADLLVPEEPIKAEVNYAVAAGRAVVLWLRLKPVVADDVQTRYDVRATATVAVQPATDVISYASFVERDLIAAFDKRERRVFAMLRTGRGPRGLALDRARARAYVALSGDDAVAALDIATGEELGRIPLQSGDSPRELALGSDGAVLLVLNEGSKTVSFVDTDRMLESSRTSAGGEDVFNLRVDRGGGRAYVFHGRPSGVTLLDLATQRASAVGTLQGDPIWGDTTRDGSILVTAQRYTPFLEFLSVPALIPGERAFAGPGTIVVKVNPRTGLILLTRRDVPEVDVFDPLSRIVIDTLRVPGPATLLAIDDLENALFALVPSRGAIAVVDLVSKRLLSEIELGANPYKFVLSGER